MKIEFPTPRGAGPIMIEGTMKEIREGIDLLKSLGVPIVSADIEARAAKAVATGKVSPNRIRRAMNMPPLPTLATPQPAPVRRVRKGKSRDAARA